MAKRAVPFWNAQPGHVQLAKPFATGSRPSGLLCAPDLVFIQFKPCRDILTALSLCNTAFEDLESSPKQGPMLKTLFPGIKPRPTSTFVFSHRLMLLAGRHVLHSNAMCLKFRFHVPSVRAPNVPADACRTVGLAQCLLQSSGPCEVKRQPRALRLVPHSPSYSHGFSERLSSSISVARCTTVPNSLTWCPRRCKWTEPLRSMSTPILAMHVCVLKGVGLSARVDRGLHEPA